MIDLSSKQFITNPYPAYRQLREAEHPVWMPHEDRTGTDGIWMFSRYRDVAVILRETQNISKDISRLVPADRLTAFDRMLLNMDPPEHTRLRALMAPQFSVRRVAQLEKRIETVVDELLSKILPGREMEFMADFAIPLPILVIAGILGVPATDMQLLKTWTGDLISGLDSARSDEQAKSRLADSMQALTQYLEDLIDSPQPVSGSLVEYLQQLRRESGKPNRMEVLGFCTLIVLAGHETTVNLLGNGLLTLLKHPEQMALLRKNPELIPAAIDEMLRFESPLQRATYRITTAPFTIGGFELEEGQQVSAVIGAANRDPEQFHAPEVFTVTRKPNRQLAFGLGIHKCLGERLARAEAKIAFSRLLEKLPQMWLMDEEPDWQEKTLFRGLKSLAVRID